MGEVWRAIQIDSGDEVALKLLKDSELTSSQQDDLRARFRHEAQLLASLDDPRIVQYLDHGETDGGTLFIAMEMLRGLTLRDHLRRHKRMSSREVLELMAEVARGLKPAHERGLIHRDLKPGNIFVTDGEQGPKIRILDFGIAKTLDRGQSDGAPRTQTGMFIGSPHYMAPEQFDGRPCLATDLYALGVIAWECLAGRRPFEGSSASVAGKHLIHEAPDLPEDLKVPEEMEDVVSWLLKKKPADRPKSVQQLLKCIDGIELDRPAPRPSGPPRSRAALGWAVLAMAGALGLAGALWVQFHRPPTEAMPVGMVEVPSGPFFMGCSPASDPGCDGRSPPGYSVSLPAFAIGEREVTVEEYAACVAEGVCSSEHLHEPQVDGRSVSDQAVHCNWGKEGRSDHPINCVTWYEAAQYCNFMGGRLPTEAEWEKAARGVDARRFPWGNEDFRYREANVADRTARKKFRWSFASRKYSDLRATTGPAGEIVAGASPYGALDMVGNVWEWTSTVHGGEQRVFRGASFLEAPEAARVTSRAIGSASARGINVGFRCAKTISDPWYFTQ